jgi:hypothetical protein
MNNTFGHQAWVAAKIWLVAVLLNSIFGTLKIWNFEPDSNMIAVLMIYEIILGLIFSFPVFIIFMVVIKILVRKNVTGHRICLAVYLCGVCLTGLSYVLFNLQLGLNDHEFFFTAEIAAVLAITYQYRSIKSLGSDFSTSYQFDYEN